MRGTLADDSPVFPTHVGMNRACLNYKMSVDGIPHACGDEPRVELDAPDFRVYSPRMWG